MLMACVDLNVCAFAWDKTYYVVADANTCDIDESHVTVQNMLLAAYRLSKRKSISILMCTNQLVSHFL